MLSGSERVRFVAPLFFSLWMFVLPAQCQTFDSWWNLGNTLYAQNRFGEAANALAHAIEVNAQDARAWGLLGLCEFETGDYAHSLEHMQRALKIGLPGQDQLEGVLRYHDGLLLAHKGEFGKALEEYRWFVKKGVTHSEFLTALGAAALHVREFPQDIAAGERDLYLGAGKAAYLSMTGANAEAQQAFHDLIARYPAKPYVHSFYASFLSATDLDAAIGEMRREVEISPASGNANALLAWLLMLDENFKDAAPYAERAEQQSAGSPTSEYVYGRMLIEKGELAQGIEHLELAEKLQPQDVMNHIALAYAYSKAQRPLDARREREISVQLAQDDNAPKP